jgi:RNA polymerase sigma factor (sigma-70 family)
MLQDKENNGFDQDGQGDSLSGKPHENESKFLDSLNSLDESEAWTMFFKEFYPLVLNYAGRYGMKGEDREEIGARVISRLFQHISKNKFQINGSIRSYLSTVVKHEVIDYFKETNRFYGNGSAILSPLAKNLIAQNDEKYNENGEPIDPEVQHKLQILQKAMIEVKKRVEARSWQIFCDVTIEEIPGIEVAEKYGIKPQTVYQRNFQILRMIKERCDLE